MPPTRLTTAGRFALLLTTLTTLMGCEEVIELDLRSVEPQLVIEATLTDDGHPATVRLSQTVDYNQTNTFPGVSNAVLVVSDDLGNRDTLQATPAAGTFVGQALTGQPGHRYTLQLQVAGRAYESTAVLPVAVPLDSLRIQEAIIGPRGNVVVVPIYRDPVGQGNYYRFRLFHNGKLNDTFFLLDDKLTDGLVNQRGLFTPPSENEDDKIKPGDSVRVEMQSIAFGSYEYLRTLNQILATNPLFSTTPANPTTNFTGGALGFFNVYSRRQLSKRVR